MLNYDELSLNQDQFSDLGTTSPTTPVTDFTQVTQSQADLVFNATTGNPTPLDSYTQVTTGGTTIEGASPVTMTPNDSKPNIGDSRHKYIGVTNGNDTYRLVDESGNILVWQVKMGDDSRNVIPGTLENHGNQISPGPEQPRPAPPLGQPTNTGPAAPVASTATNIFPDEQGSIPQAPPALSVGSVNAPANATFAATVNAQTAASASIAPVTQPSAAPQGHIIGDSSHKYIGSSGTEDFYELTDSAGHIVHWAVPLGHDSREVIPGSLAYVTKPAGNPGNSQVINTGTATNGTPGSTLTQSNSTGAATSVAYWLSRANGRDTWQMKDEAGNLIQWQTAAGAPYQAAIDSTIVNLGPQPVTATKTQSPAVTNNAPSTDSETNRSTVLGDPSHKFLGSKDGYDWYYLTDEAGNVIRWAVKVGDDSRNIVPGTLQNLGASSNGTVNSPTIPNQPTNPPTPRTQNPPNRSDTGGMTPPAVPTTKTAGQQQSTVVVFAGLAAAALNALK